MPTQHFPCDYLSDTRDRIKKYRRFFGVGKKFLAYDDQAHLWAKSISSIANDCADETGGGRDELNLTALICKADERLGMVSLPFLEFQLGALLVFGQLSVADPAAPMTPLVKKYFDWVELSYPLVLSRLRNNKSPGMSGRAWRSILDDEPIEVVEQWLPARPRGPAPHGSLAEVVQYISKATYVDSPDENDIVKKFGAKSSSLADPHKKCTLSTIIYSQVRCSLTHEGSLGRGVCGDFTHTLKTSAPIYAGEILSYKEEEASHYSPGQPQLHFPINYLFSLLENSAKVASEIGTNKPPSSNVLLRHAPTGRFSRLVAFFAKKTQSTRSVAAERRMAFEEVKKLRRPQAFKK